jgi:CRP/FNR family cyclic AMP-dependent transcriptional regulator
MSKRKPTLPTFMTEHNSLINPMLVAFARYLNSIDDKSQPRQAIRDIGLPHIKSGPKKRSVIDPSLIKSFGGKEIRLEGGETAFREGDVALHYFQIIQGSIKMLTVSADGKEFIQGMFKSGDSFGEPPLFCDFPYPSSAYAIGPCTLLKLSKDKFIDLLRKNFEVHLQLNRLLCQRLRYKSMLLSEISSYDPEHRILSLLQYLKSEFRPSPNPAEGPVRTGNKYVIPFTRQQLADMSGLRVETVIRTVKKMEREGKVRLAGRKITI